MSDNYRAASRGSGGNETGAYHASLPPGYLLENPAKGTSYRIVRRLGQGGFGITYEGQCRENNNRVAIKEFFPCDIAARSENHSVSVISDISAFNSMLKSFYKETNILLTLSRMASVVNIYDCFYANNTAYYVMEYVSGDTLLHFISANGLLNISAWQNQFRQLMQDIAQLHAQGVIHRDISPDNIILTPDGHFKLIDFGSARSFDGNQNLTVNVKRNFAPIEQYSSTGQGAYTDVYALAATIYYCLTGKLVANAVTRISKDTLVSPSSLGAQLLPTQEQALLKALALKPNDRFQTMPEFEAAFFGVSASRTSHAEDGVSLAARISASWGRMTDAPLLPILSGLFFLAAMITAITI